MIWGFFSVTHIISLAVGVAMIVGLYFLLRGKSDRTKTIVLSVLSFSGIAAILYNLLAWGSPLEYLPLHLCSLNAMVLPIAVLTKNKILNNLLLLWSLGALIALILNTSIAGASIFSWVFFFYFFPHVLEFGIPILMLTLKLTKKDVRCIASTMGITLASYTLIHFLNLWINSYTVKHNVLDSASNVIQVNYMFSITPENPLLDLFYRIIPCQYWYMYLSFAVIFVYLLILYLGDIVRLVRSRKGKSKI